jgi:hypothetical protein
MRPLWVSDLLAACGIVAFGYGAFVLLGVLPL